VVDRAALHIESPSEITKELGRRLEGSQQAGMANRDQNDQDRQRAIAEHKKITAPIVADIRNAGFNFDTLDELRRSGKGALEGMTRHPKA
jgi:hypothetical protein